MDNQRAEKDKKSPGRMKERLNSARKMSTQMQTEQQSAEGGRPSPNKRRLLRSSSSYAPQEPLPSQQTNILGQPVPQGPQLLTQQQFYPRGTDEQPNPPMPLSNRRAGSAARAMEAPNEQDKPLIVGARENITGGDQRQQEDKLRK